ncbi:hypothetical protein [Stenotrophomonas oahuensis]|uniref:Uncharacterized protein n=1 Tax=Stenotrophomonas oahuensis TaxID=3003271 RepID=A0ABY9YSQ1_9GAMM|nr:hypothetical protein [Stenotrophomonas sp. A5586]WNH53596.1 hypothetical protein PDM29_04760 [Stenotrophomonas sp. A5586]
MSTIDQHKANNMFGKIVLAGITYLDADGNALEQKQYAGEILRINEEEGVVLASLIDGEELFLPPHLDHYKVAEPGDYTLRSIDFTVTDPDYLCTWDVHLAHGNDDPDAT